MHSDTKLKQTVDTEVMRIKEAGHGLEAEVTVAEQQLQDVEAKHAGPTSRWRVSP